ncbi:MAG: ABC transporter permease [Thermoanaerobaculia bacterium]|nr:ABC transporter permease [Thermoanaerobaculia bacterium]
MSWRDLRNRWRALVQPGRFEAELDEELSNHLELEIEHRMARGESREEAERAARLALGGVEGIKEGCRDSWGSRLIQDLGRDAQGACRRLVRYRRYSLVVIASLGLGLGAALVVFSMVDAVLLRPLPFHEPDRLVQFWELTPQGERFSSSDANLLDFREQGRSLVDLAAIQWPPPRPALFREGERVQLVGMGVTPNFFRSLGVSAVVGRTFGDEESRVDAPAWSVVLAYETWRTYFGADREIVGQDIDLDGHWWTVVGVLPEDFRFGGSVPQIYTPYRLDADFPRGDHRLSAVARLAPGASLESAQREFEAIASRLADTYPDTNDGWGVFLQPLPESMLGPDVRRTQWLLLSAVGLLLLLACVNVANLFLAQLADRQDELALRRALGSGRLRILQQVLTESVVLGAAGAAVGLGLAYLTVPWIRGLPVPMPRLDEMSVDLRVAGLAALLAIVSGLLFGLLPAWNATRSTRGVHSRRQGQVDPGSGRLRSALVMCEVALATVLAVGAGLLLDSFESLASVETGIDTRDVLLAEVDLPTDHYPESSNNARRFFEQLVERTNSLPGVESVGVTMTSPFRGPNPSNNVSVESETNRDAFVPVHWRAVSPGLFRTLRVPLVRGSDFGEAPRAETVISAGLADRLWPGEDPIGQRMRWISPEGPLYEVVGVVGDVQDLALGVPPPLMVYMPQQWFGWPSMTLAVRSVTPRAYVEPIREIVSDLDHKLGSPTFSTLGEQKKDALAQPQLSLQVMSIFSLVALLLAAAGVYGVVAYAVSRRQRDLGVRLALGASPGRLVRGLTLRSLMPVAIGLVVGLALAMALAFSMQTMLYETSPVEPRVVLGVAAVLALAGLASAWMPARRAARLDPLVALREE